MLGGIALYWSNVCRKCTKRFALFMKVDLSFIIQIHIGIVQIETHKHIHRMSWQTVSHRPPFHNACSVSPPGDLGSQT